MRLAASISFMFQELPLLERFDAARAAGFAGVEIQRLAEGDPLEMARAARESGMQVVLVNVSAGDYSSGGDGLSCVPGREADFDQALERALEAASILDAHHLHLGPSRIPLSATRRECCQIYHRNIRTALTASRMARTSLLIEALNRVEAPTAMLPTVAAAVEVLRAVADERLALQLDAYHVAMSGEDPLATYTQYASFVRHIQFADAPGRHEPGTGRLDIPELLSAIDRRGYAGWFGAEYRPSGSTAASLGWLEAIRARSIA